MAFTHRNDSFKVNIELVNEYGQKFRCSIAIIPRNNLE